MKLTILILLFTAAVAFGQTPAPSNNFVPSDELNAQLPKWLRFSGEYRARMEGFTGGAFKPSNDDLYLLNRFRLNLKIQPVSWLKFNFQGQDARVWGKNQKPAAPPFQDTMDLRMAYVEIGDVEKGAFALRTGRQELFFGEQRLVGHVSWLNTARTFDAIRATVRHNGYRLDAFASSVVNIKDGEWNHHQQGNNFHGVYGGIEKLIPKAVVEPYVFWRLGAGSLDFKTYGARWVGKLPLNFDYGTEMARQSGAFGKDSIGAWAGHWRIGYTTPSLRWKPRWIAEYNYATGDDNPRDTRRGTFDILYPTPHDKYGVADQVGWKNIHHFRAGPEMKPAAQWMMSSNYHSWWLADTHDALYAAGGAAVARVASGDVGNHVGQEIDVQVTYTASKQLQLSGGFAHIFPGEFLKKATPGKSYNYPYLMLGYAF